MKNSKEYSKVIHKLFRSLKHKYSKPKKVIYEEPAESILYAIVSEHITITAAKAAIKRFDDYFVNLNDLRVCSIEEIVENLGKDTPDTRATADKISKALKTIFAKFNIVSLKHLHKTGKRPAKQLLEQICGFSNFAVNYCMLTSLQAHAIPLTDLMIEYMRKNELVHPDADDQQIEGFLTKRISAKNAYDFYYLLRRTSETSRAKTKSKKKTTKKNKIQNSS